MNDEMIDRAIVSAVSEDWTHAALAVKNICDSLGVEYKLIGERLRFLVEEKVLVSDHQDLSWGKNWVKAKVRKPN